MGDDNICHSGGLVGAERAQHIISFGEDESGKRTSIDENGSGKYCHNKTGAICYGGIHN